ncbi:acyltransferase [Priestia megaterium]|uniref:acyltransferase n=1 Tax=Priestia megaterium TaxID=1404 RepID=UPI000BFD020F|nr:acyltransferase [Priestia megaterium]PGR84216.1 galacturonic acid acetylase [Priestia megaterium]
MKKACEIMKLENIFRKIFVVIPKVVYYKVRYGKKINMNYRHRIKRSTIITTGNGSYIKIDKGLHTKRNVTLQAERGILEIGKNVFFNENCKVVAHQKIKIGDNSTFGPNVCIYDHDHDFLNGGFISSDVFIGKNVWVGANVVILRGTVIGDNCVVGAGCVVKGNYPEDTVVIQKRGEELKSIRK